ncbi:hypothetical protein K7432_012391 [Basidiobolus ranarum]|uniref:Hypervirulence associated protein TUDOR domain-containing protein n=1 Tax=Basidiobolus ranarum TaxID=34480 RepID=A0ABR2VSB7_9FUNG
MTSPTDIICRKHNEVAGECSPNEMSCFNDDPPDRIKRKQVLEYKKSRVLPSIPHSPPIFPIVSLPNMPEQYQEGDRVEYHPVGTAPQLSTGKINKVLTHNEVVGDNPVEIKADENRPRYLIENDNTHKETAYKQESITRKID